MSSELVFEISSIDELPSLAEKLISFAGERRVFLFEAEMGCGKTTFVKEICTFLGVKEGLSSPTYSIVNEYHTSDNKIIYHFDLYRLKSLQECHDIGMEDYLYSGNYCFIEWPEIAGSLLPEDCMEIRIQDKNPGREFQFIKK